MELLARFRTPDLKTAVRAHQSTDAALFWILMPRAWPDATFFWHIPLAQALGLIGHGYGQSAAGTRLCPRAGDFDRIDARMFACYAMAVQPQARERKSLKEHELA